MKKDMKSQLARALSGSTKVNQKAVSIKRSWDEVEGMLKTTDKSKKNKKD